VAACINITARQCGEHAAIGLTAVAAVIKPTMRFITGELGETVLDVLQAQVSQTKCLYAGRINQITS